MDTTLYINYVHVYIYMYNYDKVCNTLCISECFQLLECCNLAGLAPAIILHVPCEGGEGGEGVRV